MSEVEGSGKKGRIFNAKGWGGGIIILNRSASHGDGMAQSKAKQGFTFLHLILQEALLVYAFSLVFWLAAPISFCDQLF